MFVHLLLFFNIYFYNIYFKQTIAASLFALKQSRVSHLIKVKFTERVFFVTTASAVILGKHSRGSARKCLRQNLALITLSQGRKNVENWTPKCMI